jgi:hypothetical protein
MFPPGELNPLALRQLQAWQDIARGWQLVQSGRHLRCPACNQSVVMLLDTAGRQYVYTDEQKLTLTVAHLRQAHAELDPDAGP